VVELLALLQDLPVLELLDCDMAKVHEKEL
jgi:hypothetical protein